MAAMENVLDLYAEPHDPQRPVVCFDQTSTQLLADVREPLPAKPGRPRREDYEYQRGGTRNLFLTCEPKAGWRHVAITQQRTMQDFAHQMRWLVDVGQQVCRRVLVRFPQDMAVGDAAALGVGVGVGAGHAGCPPLLGLGLATVPGRRRCFVRSASPMLRCTIAPEHRILECRCLPASLPQPRFQKVDHQGRDAGSLVDHDRSWPTTGFLGK